MLHPNCCLLPQRNTRQCCCSRPGAQSGLLHCHSLEGLGTHFTACMAIPHKTLRLSCKLWIVVISIFILSFSDCANQQQHVCRSPGKWRGGQEGVHMGSGEDSGPQWCPRARTREETRARHPPASLQPCRSSSLSMNSSVLVMHCITV